MVQIEHTQILSYTNAAKAMGQFITNAKHLSTLVLRGSI